MARYLAGASIAELCDESVRDAMHELGELWQHDEGGIFVEHRGTDCCLQAIAQLRALSPEAPPTAPLALGGAPEDDPYLLPSLMAAAVLAATGMRATNLGPDTPVSAFRHAVLTLRPQLVWISVTTALAPARSRSISRWLATLPTSIVAVVGGQLAKSLSTPAHVQRAGSMTRAGLDRVGGADPPRRDHRRESTTSGRSCRTPTEPPHARGVNDSAGTSGQGHSRCAIAEPCGSGMWSRGPGLAPPPERGRTQRCARTHRVAPEPNVTTCPCDRS